MIEHLFVAVTLRLIAEPDDLGIHAVEVSIHVADKMRPLVGAVVTVTVWGAPLSGAATFHLESVRTPLGPALHFYLRPLPEGKALHLKVAQPRGITVDDRSVAIGEAKYVQWD